VRKRGSEGASKRDRSNLATLRPATYSPALSNYKLHPDPKTLKFRRELP